LLSPGKYQLVAALTLCTLREVANFFFGKDDENSAELAVKATSQHALAVYTMHISLLLKRIHAGCVVIPRPEKKLYVSDLCTTATIVCNGLHRQNMLSALLCEQPTHVLPAVLYTSAAVALFTGKP